jgi:hypothetical protein
VLNVARAPDVAVIKGGWAVRDLAGVGRGVAYHRWRARLCK